MGILPAQRDSVPSPPGSADTVSYIMAGQSNMAGRGMVAPEDTTTDEAVLELDADGHFIRKQEPNRVFQSPLFAGLDCGRSFGNALQPRLRAGTKLCLTQCSVSSTSIEDWLGDSLRGIRLFSVMLNRARTGMRSGRLGGVLWMQGESNADSTPGPLLYGGHLTAFINRVRRETGVAALPFYVALLPAWCKKPFRDSVNAGIRIAAASLPAVRLIKTDDLSARPDSIHLDAAGQRQLGWRMALAAAADL